MNQASVDNIGHEDEKGNDDSRSMPIISLTPAVINPTTSSENNSESQNKAGQAATDQESKKENKFATVSEYQATQASKRQGAKVLVTARDLATPRSERVVVKA